jgi:heme exporter protein A
VPLVELTSFECVRDDRTLFTDLDLRLDAGELIELRGPNGAGKSTLLRCISGLYPDYEGKLAVAPLLYQGHKPGFNERLSPVENLGWFARLHAHSPGPEQEDGQCEPISQDIVVALARVGLAGYESVPCAALSAGQLRRVGIARLLLSSKPLWLLDEPLTALDAAAVQLLLDTLQAHLDARGGAICATHQPLTLPDARLLELG